MADPLQLQLQIIILLKFTFEHRLDSGRYCIRARHAKNEINAARHSLKVGQIIGYVDIERKAIVRYLITHRFYK